MSDPREPLPTVNRRMLVVGFCVYSLFLLFPIFALLVSQDAKATAPSEPDPAVAVLEARAKGLAGEMASKDGEITGLREELAKVREEGRAIREQFAQLQGEADRLKAAATEAQAAVAGAEAGRLEAVKRLAELQAASKPAVDRKPAISASGPSRTATPKAAAGVSKPR